jgi:hypothetical protein
MSYDVTLIEGADGHVEAHDPECPIVKTHREAGRMLCTMLCCEQSLPKSLACHVCLNTTKETK